MKKTTVLVLTAALCVAPLAIAQVVSKSPTQDTPVTASQNAAPSTLDCAIWMESTEANSARSMPWCIFSSSRGMYAQARYNYDADHVLGTFLGKSYGQRLQVIPQMGILIGDTKDYRGIGPEVDFSISGREFNAFLMTQYSFGLPDRPDFTYYWLDTTRQVTTRLALGVDAQLYKATRNGASGSSIDLGPRVKMSLGSLYVFAWGTVNTSDTNTKKLYFGVGRVFSR